MKNAIIIILLAIFSFNFGGSYAILQFQKYQIRKEIKREIRAGISENDLIKIVVTSENKKELIWKDSKEFSFKGKMYDVVHSEKINSNTQIYHCISDSQETKLIAQYTKDLQKKRKNKNNQNPLKVFKFIEKIEPLPQKKDVAINQNKLLNNFDYFENYAPLTLEISSPPPKQIL